MYVCVCIDGCTLCLAQCGPGAIPLIPSLPHLLLYLLVSFTLLLFPLLLASSIICFSIPAHSTRIVQLCFQAGCHRR